MDATLIVGQRILGLPFRETLAIYQDGLSHRNKRVLWSDVRRIKIAYFEQGGGEGSPSLYWAKLTLETTKWKVVLDSRVTIQPEDDLRYALGDPEQGINPAFKKTKKFLEKFCQDKIVVKEAFCGSFDFSEWTSWLGAVMVLLLTGFVCAGVLFALR